MGRLFIFLLIFIFSVYLGLKIAADPGLAFFSYQHWSVEMPLWFAAVAMLILFFLGYLLVRLFDSVDFSLYRWKNWLQWRRKNKSYSKTNRGFLELIEHNWQSAESYLLEGIAQSDAPLINYLAAAKAAHQQGAYDKRDAYLQRALEIAPHAEIVIGIIQAQLLLEQQQFEQALASLTHLRTLTSNHKVVLKLLERVYAHLGDWQELLKLLPSLRKAKLVNAEQAVIFEKNIYKELLLALANKKESENSIHALWDSLPRNFKKDAELICVYTKLMLPYAGQAAELETLLSKVIKQSWNKEAAYLYGLLVGPNPVKQLAIAETWLKHYPDQAILFLTLGRLCVRCQLWGKARNYYENSLKLSANPETYMAYGDLLESLGERVSAVSTYRDGLQLLVQPK